MAKSQFSIGYRKVPIVLRQMRESANLTQRALAKRMGKTQSWVFKSESTMRRIDISEFLEWSVGCGVDPVEAFKRLLTLR